MGGPSSATLRCSYSALVRASSTSSLANTLALIFAEMFKKLKADLKTIKSKLAVSSDTWTTRSMMFTFAGSIGSWITEDWELVERVLDFHPIEDKEHEGKYAGAAMARRLSELGVLEQLSAGVFDSATTNDVLMRTLSRILMEKFDIQFVPENSQIRCLAHVVNLVVQKFLATLNEADDPEVVDYYLPNKDLPFHYDPDDDPDLRDLENETFEDEEVVQDEGELDAETMTELAAELAKLSPLQKLRLTMTKICASPQRRKQFKSTAASIYQDKLHKSGRKVSSLMVICDVKHRWNFTEAMISRALVLRKAIQRWVLERDELHPLLLSDEHWKLLEALGGILKVFTKVTLQMSKSSTPTLPWVLPMYEKMLVHLWSTRADEKILQPLRVAASAGLEKLEMYYAKARACQFNIIVTVLHPSLGLSWFRKLDQGEERQEHAQILFTHVFQAYKKTYDDEKAASRAQEGNSDVQARPVASASFLDDICMFDADDKIPLTGAINELDQFFSAFQTYGRGDHDGPLLWWKEFAHHFPVVARMARDFLAIPGTSVSVERLFSKSRHLCHEAQGSMKAETIMKAMLTKMWIKAGYLEY
ncbi:Dimer-Tnp-hAT domain-containing protein [Mycena venus]|uniref:Dimer-Tnp-hAT domain-containing protein n=1 Tax=Mycena venus TaxID=2733690 RepID=A0A8H7D814_9AGAR|nr:Dimer-Tnp-hAT domain-containing protein [Mycena venus]